MNMGIGERITELLEKKGITAYTLSNETGLSQATLSRIIDKNTKYFKVYKKIDTF